MGTPALSSPLSELHSRLPELMLRDQRRLRRRLDGVRRVRSREAREKIAAEILADVERAERRLAAAPGRRARGDLSGERCRSSQRKDDILAAIRDHQVVIIAGETGSGKTTQIPKICLELGRGVSGLIGHTQPRRIAARTVAERIAEELGTELGEAVGYKVRFTDQASDRTLRQADDRRHPAGRAADRPAAGAVRHADHRRGARAQPQHRLHPRLPQAAPAQAPRPQGHHHLGDDRPRAVLPPLRRRPDHRGLRPHLPRRGPLPPLDEDDDQTQGIVDAVDELFAEGPGDILVFLSGEREIRDTADALAKAESATPRSCRSTPGCQRRRAAPRLPARTPAAASCWPPTSPRPR